TQGRPLCAIGTGRNCQRLHRRRWQPGTRSRAAGLRKRTPEGGYTRIYGTRGSPTCSRCLGRRVQDEGRLRDQLQPLLLQVLAAPSSRGNRSRPAADRKRNCRVAGRGGGMKCEPYAEYTAPGVGWLNSIPAHWQLLKLKYISLIQFSSVDKHVIEGEEAVRLCNYVDVYKNDF